MEIKKDTKILNMQDPFITSYPFHANLFSIIGNLRYVDNWVLNYYIQLEAPKNLFLFNSATPIDFCIPRIEWELCPFVECYTINKDILPENWSSIEQFIINCINKNYYIYLCVNQFYIPNTKCHNKINYLHENFIFGYDAYNFFIADFFGDYKIYGYEKIRIDDFIQAFNTTHLCREKDYIGGIKLIRLKDVYYNSDIELIKEFLADYIMGVNTIKKFRIPNNEKRSNFFQYGINIYNTFKLIINALIEKKLSIKENPYYIMRSFQLLYDHKKIMLKRLNFLNYNDRNNKFLYILNESKKLKLLLLKYILDNTKFHLLNLIIEKIDNIQNTEKEAMEELLNALN